MNIRDEGLRILAVGHIATASGERVRQSKGNAFTRHHSAKEESSRPLGRGVVKSTLR